MRDGIIKGKDSVLLKIRGETMTNRAKEYGAGIMSESSWFLEFKNVLLLKKEGLTKEEIKSKCIEENLFGGKTENRIVQMYGYLTTRASRIDNQLLEIFCSSDIATQKIINFVAILKGDKLYSEFINEVYRERAILGFEELDNSDVNVFFTMKTEDDNALSKWKDTTIKKVRNCYLNFMVDANLLRKEGKKYYITTPILDIALERYLELNGEETLLKAITGAR